MRATNEIFKVIAPDGTRLLVAREIADEHTRNPVTRVWVMGFARDATRDETKFAMAAIKLQRPLWRRKLRGKFTRF